MAKLLKLRGGTTSQHGSFTGAAREVTVDTDKETLVVHDGSTAGGHSLMRSDIMQENLDVNGNSIVSSSNGNIAITPNGSGKVVIDGLSHPTSDGSAGQFLKTDGSGTLSFATVSVPVEIPSGTSMLFQQTAAPTGWTKQTTHDDKALRIVTGSVGTGGSVAFSTALGSGATVAGGTISGDPGSNLSVSISGNISNHTLSISQIAAHSHNFQVGNSGTGGNTTRGHGNNNSGGNFGNNGGTLQTGGGGSHNHGHNLSGSMSGNITAGNLAVGASTAAINVNYVDFIIANKD